MGDSAAKPLPSQAAAFATRRPHRALQLRLSRHLRRLHPHLLAPLRFTGDVRCHMVRLPAMVMDTRRGPVGHHLRLRPMDQAAVQVQEGKTDGHRH